MKTESWKDNEMREAGEKRQIEGLASRCPAVATPGLEAQLVCYS